MGLLGKLFGQKNGAAKPAKHSMQEEALKVMDSLHAQIVQLEENPDIPEAEKAERIGKLKQEMQKFSDAMGWKYEA